VRTAKEIHAEMRKVRNERTRAWNTVKRDTKRLDQLKDELALTCSNAVSEVQGGGKTNGE
jgi:hypothetical protein